MSSKSIIEVIRDKNRDLNQHIARVTGRRYMRKPNYYHNRKTGEDYYAIVGALAFPAGRVPGFGVIVAVLKDDENMEAPVFKVVDEIAKDDLEALLVDFENRRLPWGYPAVLDIIIGDTTRFISVLNNFNQRRQGKADQTGGIYLVPPAGFEDPNRTEVYLQQIWSLLRPSIHGKKRLVLGDCQRLRAHLQNLSIEVKQIEDYPAVAALAYAVSSLEATRPWLAFTQHEQYQPTIIGDFEGLDRWPWDEEEYDGTIEFVETIP